MSSDFGEFSKFQDAYLDYLEGLRAEPPALDDLPEEQRRAAEAFVDSITATRGVDPYASRPSIEQLLASRSKPNDHSSELSKILQDHLRQTVDPRASVTPDPASLAAGLPSVSVIQARGMRIRLVPEATPVDLGYALTMRADEIAKVFRAFPDSHAVLYTTTGQEPLGVVVDRGDVQGAIETPSGQRRNPRARRAVTGAARACEEWLSGMIPDFRPLSADVLDSTVSAASVNPYDLATEVVREVSTAGARARIEAKRVTWCSLGDQEVQSLAAILQEAQHGRLSAEGYVSLLDELVGIAA